MMRPVETFIVRLWAPAPDLAEEVAMYEVRGSVEHVGSKRQAPFRSGQELLDLMRAVASDVASTPTRELRKP
jgi:hypothetical protein